MRICILFIAYVFLLSACKHSQSLEGEALAEVNGQILYESDLKGIIPAGLSSADSLLFVENYIKKWVTDELVYDVALNNQHDIQEVNKLVEAYKESLIRHRYQEQLVTERLSPNIREAEKLTYYDDNQERFKLTTPILKGLFLKIAVNAPGIDDVKKWYRSNSIESLEKIEKYSIQNANIYEYFYDRWVDFDDVVDNIPLTISDPNAFLKSNKAFEVSDSTYCYLLNVQEFIPAGNVAPYEYVETQIIEMLVNQKRKEFLENFENELYTDAVKRGKVKLNYTTTDAK